MARCMNHPDREAGRACAGCGKPICEDCVEFLEEEGAYCYDCAVDRQLAEFRGREAEARATGAPGETGKRKVGSRAFLAVAVAAALLIAGASGFIIYKHFAFDAAPAEGSPEQQEAWSGDDCIINMQEVRLALRAYHDEHGDYPADLEALGPYLRVKAACPATQAPYVYRLKGTGYEIACPNPQDHGAGSLKGSDVSVPAREGGTAPEAGNGG
ncbi:MAG: B-box zinc finger protein [Actinobacteria bacterium]|nr:B-box zinc finger protein [Actinomycetota bacterium]